MGKTACSRFMANYLMMVKVSAYRLKYIQLQIYNFHLEEAIILTKITRTPNSRKRGFSNSSSKKMYQIPRPPDTGVQEFFVSRKNLLL